MRYSAVGLAMVAVMSTGASGQQWTAAEREIIDHVQACWEAWGEEDTNVFDGPCLSDPENRFWWMTEGVPNQGPAEWKRWAAALFPRIEASVHFQIRPIGVQVFGDVALYQFWATSTQVDANGEVVTSNQHRLEVLQRRNGRWVFIGGAGAPEPGG